MGALKLGQPVPELNLASVAKRGEAHPRQEKVPGSFTKLSSEVFGASVPSLRRTENCSGVRISSHSALVFGSVRESSDERILACC